MKAVQMKSMHDGESRLLQTASILRALARLRRVGEVRETAITDVTLTAAFAAFVLIYVAMFVALYMWSRYAPLFPSDSAAGPIGNAMCRGRR